MIVVPSTIAEEAAAGLEEAMLEAGKEVLIPWGVPVQVDTAKKGDGKFPRLWLKD
ncbi:MAG: hypothetical protein AB1815_05825 [Bacillota bacterium]